MAELAQVLRHLTPIEDPKALVDASTGDDAAVYLLDDGRALVVTVDFFTPLVDEPYDFGRIAAANALSDLYAMGARPLFALNLLGFPRRLLGEGLAEEVIRGGAEIARIAGIPIMGGHSVDDPEPKYGMVAVGEASPGALVTNTKARPGDRLVLTKPLGTGIIATAIKAGQAPQAVMDVAVASMTTLNRAASECMVHAGVQAATDVTGFGFLGHLHVLMEQSGVAARIDSRAVPVLEGVRDLARAGHVPGGSQRNLDDLSAHVGFDDVDDVDQLVLADAQTSGGLLMAVNPEVLVGLLDDMAAKDVSTAVVGEVVKGPAGRIEVSG
jgi:selenide, water dikinase